MKNKQFLMCILFLTALVFSCDEKEEPMIAEEPELITTLTYTLTPMSGGEDVVLSFSDIDGAGPTAPVITGGTLAPNETYEGSLDLQNEAEDPAESITEEIEEEAEEHQFFFKSTVAGLDVAYNDQDANGNPIGLSSTLRTGEAGSGNLTILLLHEPVKTAEGVSGGDDTNAQGETDIEATFPINVQ